MSPRPNRASGSAIINLETKLDGVPRIGSPIPPTPGGFGVEPKPSPRFGAHSAWKHFFHMVALGGGPNDQHHQRNDSSDGRHQPKTIDDDLTTATTVSSAASDDARPSQPATNIHGLPLLKDATRRHIERVFTTLRGRMGDYVTRERLEEFLHETQGGLVHPLEKDVYTLGDFIYVWLHDYSAALRPAGKKDLSKPITNYFISSSHNTYIGLGNQLNGEVSAEAYRTVLEGDCRCVEIDVWNGEGWAEGQARTSSRSRSSRRGDTEPYKKHKRHLSNLSTLSTGSLPAAAQSLVDIMDQKWHELTGGSREHSPKPSNASSASASMSQLHLTLPTARHSSASLDKELLDPNSDREPSLRHAKSAESLRSNFGRKSRSRSRSREPRTRKRVEPEVTHAHTVQGLGDVGLARRIPLRQVCRVIRESAFKTNKLPLIVSLEVHATGEQQDMMVDIMKEEWGEHLLDERLPECDPEKRQPSLEELMGKILVKVKRPAQPAQPALGLLAKSGSQLTVPTIHDDDASGSDDERERPPMPGDQPLRSSELPPAIKKSKTKIGETLGKLAIYTHSERYKDFSAPGAQTLSHIFSIDEYKILKLHQSKHRDMFIHNRMYFMRAYPHSTRVNSTNLDPSLYWRKGVQMVALNWQRSQVDEAIMLNHGMFESEQGWVLKPQGYLSSDSSESQAEAGNYQTLNLLRITVLAGQFLPLPGESYGDGSDSSTVSSVSTADSAGFRPFVKCELHVETPEERNAKKAIKSGLVQDGQYKLFTKSSETENPDWGLGQALEFPRIDKVVEELSFVRFKIEDEGLVKDRLAAWACIRLDRLQQGYRFIDLKDARGKPSAGKLLVKIEKVLR